VIDVSRMLDRNLEIYPGDPPLEITPVTSLDTHPYCLSHVAFGTHTGTHLDAPAHFIRGGMTFPQIPLERLNGPCLVADEVGEACERLLLRQPHIDEATARQVVALGIGLLGVNSQSVEAPAEGFPVHHALLGNGVLVLEGLVLDHVAPGRYELVCLPLKLDVPDGGPVRAVLRPL
jgi:arylformamidase